MGFSTSRTFVHRTITGELIPGTHCHPEELLGIAQGMIEGGSGVFQMISDNLGSEPDLAWMKAIGKATGEPLIFSLVDVTGDRDPFEYRETLDSLTTIYETEGVDIRAAVMADEPDISKSMTGLVERFDKMFPLGDPPDYEPRAEDSIEARAKEKGVSPQEYAYDTLLEQGGRQLIFVPVASYSGGNLDILHEQLSHSRSTASLSDGGAHVASICDASFTTFMLTHWVRDRTRGDRLQLEEVIRKQTGEPAAR